MSDHSAIEWTDATWNPVTGCTKISPGCKHCYAAREWQHLKFNSRSVYFEREFHDIAVHPERLEIPLRWRRPRRIFVNSMSDLFHARLPFDFIRQVMEVVAACPAHIFQVLTKREDNALMFFEWWVNDLGRAIPPNLHMGVSVEDQEYFNRRAPVLLKIKAKGLAVAWISYEPALGPIDARWYIAELDWIVAGGESGNSIASCRPSHPEWFRSIRDQCVAAGVPFNYKQWGNWSPCAPRIPHPAMKDRFFQFPDGQLMLWQPHKSASGRLLDGVDWRQQPRTQEQPPPCPDDGDLMTTTTHGPNSNRLPATSAASTA